MKSASAQGLVERIINVHLTSYIDLSGCFVNLTTIRAYNVTHYKTQYLIKLLLNGRLCP